tara:strand:+ start:10710 stop:12488 length:1779 start_codon:yes stop_codon:yes gene_type:complete
MKRLIKIFFPIILTSSIFAQNIEANWEVNFIWSEWDFVARDSSGLADSASSHTLTVSWPSSDNALFTFPYKTFAPGDTILHLKQPLVAPWILKRNGIRLNVDFNNDGTFTINDGSTYPTTQTVNCSTGSIVLPVAENGTWTSTAGYDHLTHADPWGALNWNDGQMTGYFNTFGWGIGQSGVFPLFEAPDIVAGTYGTDFGLGAPVQSFGKVTVGYLDAARTTPNFLEVYWENYNGPETGSGWDEEREEYTTLTGVSTNTGDTVTVKNIAALAAAAGITVNASTNYPILGGSGVPTGEFNPLTGDPIFDGLVTSNHVYVFDPLGADGVALSGDEPFAPTGYYLTYNFMQATNAFSAFNTHLAAGEDIATAAAAAVDSVARGYVDATTAAALGAAAAETLVGLYEACVSAGGTSTACLATFQAGPTVALTAIQQASDAAGLDLAIDDSGYDSVFDSETGLFKPGRLIMEVDNVCIPNYTTNRPTSRWYNTAYVSLDDEAPIANKFELHGNYPNPFNPSTTIKFATEKFSDVSVTIYSLLGQKVQTVHSGELSPGTYNIMWYGVDSDNNRVPSGVYFYEVKSDNRVLRGKMLLLK